MASLHEGGAPERPASCSLLDSGLACDLVARPWEYPGVAAPVAGLLVADRFFPVAVVAGRPAGEAQVVDAEGRWSPAPGVVLSLDEALRREGVALTAGRTVVVATGSNAAPAVMHRKCLLGRVSAVVPFLPATVESVGIGHSAHVSTTGYVAAAPFPAPGITTRVTVSLLDVEQRACLDRTEPNYELQALDADRFPLELASGERPAGFNVYESRWGVVAPSGVPLALRRQQDLFERLWELPGAQAVLGPRADVRTVTGRLAGEAGRVRRRAMRTWLDDSGAVMAARLGSAAEAQDADVVRRWAPAEATEA